MSQAAVGRRVVTVFGGTGFLGRRVVRHLRQHGFAVRIATRHPERADALFGRDDPDIRAVAADIHHQRSIDDALLRVHGAVNASAFMSSMAARPSTPCTSKGQDASPPRSARASCG